LSFGGTCFPRDTWAFIKASEKIGLQAEHVKAAQNINALQDSYLLQKVLSFPFKEVSILGLGFKNNTPVITESSSIKLIENLIDRDYKINVFDPVEEAMENTRQIFGDKLIYHPNFIDCFNSSKQLIILNPYKEFKILENLVDDDNFVLDCWRSYEFKKGKILSVGVA
jgi:UDPglucose 6-dehydrogenase